MKRNTILLVVAFLTINVFGAFAQNNVTATFHDSTNDDPLGFATVSLTQKGANKAYKYALTSDDGFVKFDGVKSGTFVLKVELLGYKPFEKEITVPGKNTLGIIKVDPDRKMLEAATVSAAGNAILIKKDTIEYNASSFKTTDNDVLEDLLKKLPGVEVSEDGSITANGQTISKITINGKTFFLDDPQIASKNIPAKMIDKLKVIEKKSDQAEFTGIDDGEEEHVIDLTVKKGMMKGAFGNVMAGAGHDIPANSTNSGDTRFQGAAFMGKFTDKTQISLILNANNTNNRGFNDLSGSMMGNMRGGGRGMGGGQGGWGGQNGITTSYMGGLNGAWDLFDDKMDLGANYVYNYTNKDVKESTQKMTYLTDQNVLAESDGYNITRSGGHRIGVRLEHKFSEKTSILFIPQIDFGNGGYEEVSNDITSIDKNGSIGKVNEASSVSTGNNKNISTNGFLLFRQRLGIPGRTLTAMTRYSFSNNKLDGLNRSNTIYFDGSTPDSDIDQSFNRKANSGSIMGRVTYTEPLGHNFYFEANYRITYSKSTSDKETLDLLHGGVKDFEYSNNIINENLNQEMGVNFMYQKDKLRAQLGFAAQPTHTFNSTTKWNAAEKSYSPRTYSDDRWNFAPQGMLFYEISETTNVRFFYRGRTSQPSTQQLMPVPDNTDPLNISFGNPQLKPYFAHNLRGDFRTNNKKKFSSFNLHLEGSFTKDPIVNMMWYGSKGEQFTMPFNGPSSGNFGFNTFLNLPIGSSNFTISNMLRANVSRSSSYVGREIDMTTYYDAGKGFYDFMEELSGNFADPTYFAAHITTNTTTTLGATERLNIKYRIDALELTASGRTRVNNSWYTISTDKDNTTTWNNQIRLGVNWTWDAPGLTLKSEFNYNWYRGYATAQPSEYVLNAEIQKLLFKKKFTLALKGYDILGQSKNLTVTDSGNYHRESLNNTLGRYIILSLTYRFGTFDKSKMRGGMAPGMGGPGMRGPGMGGPGGRR